MKYLIVIVVVALVVWLMLRGRDRAAPRAERRGSAPKAMAQCRHCGVHLPRAEAVEDSRGAFCSEAHRLAGPPER